MQSICASSEHLLVGTHDTENNGLVLKQLLLIGKEGVSEKRDETLVKCSLPNLNSNPASSLSRKAFSYSPFRRNKLGNTSHKNLFNGQISKNNRMLTHQSYRPYMWISTNKDKENWSLPILTPAQEGRQDSPPPIPVAYIRPYVEPQVMYNPFFLWQLYSYKQTCNNNCIQSLASVYPKQ